MGWASGSVIADEVWELVRPYLKTENQRREVAKGFVEIFEDYDCDTMEETCFYEIAYPEGREEE